MQIEITFFEWIAIFGIILEIFGFLFILSFWRVPTYPALNRWFKLLKIYKLFFGTKRYEKRLIDIVVYNENEEKIEHDKLLLERDPIVPRSFIPFWNSMKWFGFALVMIGLLLQIIQMLDVNP